MMEFVLDCKKWRSGGEGSFKMGDGKTRLLNSKGYMCCVGQLCVQVGMSEDEIFEKAAILSEEGTILQYIPRRDLGVLYHINDDVFTVRSPAAKIDRIRDMLEYHGHTLKVINEECCNTCCS